jgi:hypothetical protein
MKHLEGGIYTFSFVAMSISDTSRYIGEKYSIIDDADPKAESLPAIEAMIVERKGIYHLQLR